MIDEIYRYVREIKELVYGLPLNSRREYIGRADKDNKLVLYIDFFTDVYLFNVKDREKKRIETFDYDTIHEVYVYLHDNRKLLLPSLDNLIELYEPDEENNFWVVKPQEIQSDDGTIIGRIGITIESVENDNMLLSAIYISADKTWATLTAWKEGDDDDIETAKRDVECIIKSLEKISELFKVNRHGGI